MSDSLFSKERSTATALCTVLAGVFHAVIYGWLFSAITPGTPVLMVIDALMAGIAFFTVGWVVTRLVDRSSGDLSECLFGFANLLACLFGGTIVALAAGALHSAISTSHVALFHGAWNRIGLSALWCMLSMFAMGVVNNASFGKPIRQNRVERAGGDFRISAWHWQ